MPQNDNKKSVDVMRRKAQFSAAADRRSVKRPTKTFITRRQQMKKSSPTIIKKEEIIISPANSSTKRSFGQSQNQSTTEKKAQADQSVSEPEMIKVQRVVTKKKTAIEIKEAAIQKAIQNASSEDEEQQGGMTQQRHFKRKKSIMRFGGLKRLALALACTAAAVFAIVYFVNINSPDIALRVAAIQNGIDASYPKFIPRGFSLTDITSENGKITISFKNYETDSVYSIIEEKSSWDSNALLSNYVKNNYRDDYTVIKEQGLTLYVTNAESCWVNGGILYKIKVVSGDLTKKQVKTIAVSL